MYIYMKRKGRRREGVSDQEENTGRAGGGGLGLCMICVSVSHGN